MDSRSGSWKASWNKAYTTKQGSNLNPMKRPSTSFYHTAERKQNPSSNVQRNGWHGSLKRKRRLDSASACNQQRCLFIHQIRTRFLSSATQESSTSIPVPAATVPTSVKQKTRSSIEPKSMVGARKTVQYESTSPAAKLGKTSSKCSKWVGKRLIQCNFR